MSCDELSFWASHWFEVLMVAAISVSVGAVLVMSIFKRIFNGLRR